jgi:hypothetical protein
LEREHPLREFSDPRGAAGGLVGDEVDASVAQAHACHSTSIDRSQARCSRPHRRSSSIVPVLATVARGNVELDNRRSTTSVSTPYEPSVTPLARPPGPAPTTTTSNSSIPTLMRRHLSSDNVSERM